MKIEIEIPKEFEEHFKQDKFKDSLERIMADIWHSLEIGNCLCAGRYEYETIEMLEEALENSKTAYDVDKVIEELETNQQNALEVEESIKEYNVWNEAIEIVKQGGVSNDVCKWRQTSTTKYKTGCGYKLEEFFDTNACFCKQCGRRIKVQVSDTNLSD